MTFQTSDQFGITIFPTATEASLPQPTSSRLLAARGNTRSASGQEDLFFCWGTTERRPPGQRGSGRSGYA